MMTKNSLLCALVSFKLFFFFFGILHNISQLPGDLYFYSLNSLINKTFETTKKNELSDLRNTQYLPFKI